MFDKLIQENKSILHNESVIDKLIHPEKRKVGDKFCLICCQGGHVGVFSAGVLEGFEEYSDKHGLDLYKVFDSAFGVSAGVPNMLFFLTHEVKKCSAVYYDDFVDDKFISIKPNNFLKRKSILNLEYAIEVLSGITNKKLKLEKIANNSHNTKSFSVVTNSDTGETEYLSLNNANSEREAMQMLKASCASAFFYGKDIEVNGQNYTDGYLTDYVPIKKALKLGVNHFLILMNHPLEYIPATSNKIAAKIQEFIISKKRSAKLAKAFSERREKYKESINNLVETAKNFPVYVFEPDKVYPLLNTKQTFLKKVHQAGKDKIIELIDYLK